MAADRRRVSAPDGPGQRSARPSAVTLRSVVETSGIRAASRSSPSRPPSRPGGRHGRGAPPARWKRGPRPRDTGACPRPGPGTAGLPATARPPPRPAGRRVALDGEPDPLEGRRVALPAGHADERVEGAHGRPGSSRRCQHLRDQGAREVEQDGARCAARSPTSLAIGPSSRSGTASRVRGRGHRLRGVAAGLPAPGTRGRRWCLEDSPRPRTRAPNPAQGGPRPGYRPSGRNRPGRSSAVRHRRNRVHIPSVTSTAWIVGCIRQELTTGPSAGGARRALAHPPRRPACSIGGPRARPQAGHGAGRLRVVVGIPVARSQPRRFIRPVTAFRRWNGTGSLGRPWMSWRAAS